MQSIKDGFSSLGSLIKGAINDLCTNILQGIKDFFVPKDGEIEQAVQDIKTAFFNKFGLDNWSVSSAFGAEKTMQDVDTTLNLGSVSVEGKVIDWSYFKNAIVEFRPYIRGFVAFLIVLYSINQFLSLIGQGGLSTLGSSKGEYSGIERIPNGPDKGGSFWTD